MKDYNLENRKLVIGGIAIVIVVIYILRLFTIQLLSDDYRKSADSNAFLKQVEFPSRGVIRDRNGKLLVYNQPAYDIMVVMNEEKGHLDTLDFCETLGITKDYFIKRMNDIKDRNKNPGYSRFTQQLFMSQIDDKDFSVFQEKMFRFPGFSIQRRTIRQYEYPYGAHVLGDVGEVSQADIDEDSYYQPGDYIGKLGVERSYEKDLRGEKGVKILLRDAHGRIQGKYQQTLRWVWTSVFRHLANVCWKARSVLLSPSNRAPGRCCAWFPLLPTTHVCWRESSATNTIELFRKTYGSLCSTVPSWDNTLQALRLRPLKA